MIDELLRALRPGGSDLGSRRLSPADEPNALFQLDGVLPRGWVELTIRVRSVESASLRAQVIAQSASTGHSTTPVEMGRDGRGQAVARLPADLSALRLQVKGLSAADLPRVHVRRLHAFNAALRLALPLLKRRFREPETLHKSAAKLIAAVAQGGPRAVLDHLLRKEKRRLPSMISYEDWRATFDELTESDRTSIRARSASLTASFSLLMPISDPGALRGAIASASAQLHPRWELLIASEAKDLALLQGIAGGDERIRLVEVPGGSDLAGRYNALLARASGDFVVLTGPGARLREHALYLLACSAADDLVYGDEDSIDAAGRPCEPIFKPDWNPDLLRSCDYLGHPTAIRRSLAREVGGFRGGPFAGAEEYDLILRASRAARSIGHVPFVLESVPPPSRPEGADEAAVRALQDCLGAAARAEKGPLRGTCRVRWPIPHPAPLASLIIPTRDGRDVLEPCVESLLAKTAYRPFELLVVDNQSRSPETLDYLASLERRRVARVLRFDAPFNFSALNNFAAAQATGAVLGLLNNDIEALEEGWLEEMVSQAMRPDIGAVGARLLYPDRTVQHAGVVVGIGGVASHPHKRARSDDPGYAGRAQLVQDVSAVTAACLLVRSETFHRVGGFDEAFPVAFNDVDFCLRVRQLGLRNLWTPFATLIHHESKSRGSDEVSRGKRARFRSEYQLMRSRWGEALLNDPAYSPNLTLEADDFSFAWPPRVRKPWL